MTVGCACVRAMQVDEWVWRGNVESGVVVAVVYGPDAPGWVAIGKGSDQKMVPLFLANDEGGPEH